MTVHYPDISGYQSGLSLAGAPAAMAKATEGTTFRDHTYTDFRAQATAMGIPFCGYHFLRTGAATAQAGFAHSVVGSTPLMLDVEVGIDNTWPSLDDAVAFIDSYRAFGGTLTTIYLPHWFWQGHWGSPSLQPFADRGVGLISSNYGPYSDTGPGWAPYGGMTPVIWQHSSTYPFNGMGVDMNGFKGSAAELGALFAGTAPTVEDEMFLLRQISDGSTYKIDGVDPVTKKVRAYGVKDPAELADLKAAGFQVREVNFVNPAYYVIDPPAPSGGGGSGPTAAEIAKAVNDDAAARLAD